MHRLEVACPLYPSAHLELLHAVYHLTGLGHAGHGYWSLNQTLIIIRIPAFTVHSFPRSSIHPA